LKHLGLLLSIALLASCQLANTAGSEDAPPVEAGNEPRAVEVSAHLLLELGSALADSLEPGDYAVKLLPRAEHDATHEALSVRACFELEGRDQSLHLAPAALGDGVLSIPVGRGLRSFGASRGRDGFSSPRDCGCPTCQRVPSVI